MKKKFNLEDYTWGLGIEHEMHIFHKPFYSKTNKIKDFIIFDSYSVVERILEDKENSKSNLSYDDYNFLKNIPFETSGRRCNDKWVIQAVPVKMPEFITLFPFCSIKDGRDILNMTEDIIEYKNKFYDLIMKDKETQKLVKKYGELSEYPFGMTRYLKCPIEIKNNVYKFDKNNLLPEYNGSYHVTFTLPYTIKTTNKEFTKAHQNFCNQLQWLEPLMMAAYFTGDEYAPGSLKSRVRGSFRVMMVGWGNLAGSDIRLFNKGIGRYAKTPTYWRKNLSFKDVNKLKPCYKPSAMAIKEKAYSSLSSDFRTFGSTDPSRPMHRESGIPITKPNGVEFRIFDHFPDRYIKQLLLFISLVAENSRVTKTRGYVYENKYWIYEIHNIMKNGYKARISNDFINLLRKKLDIKINTKSIIAIDIFKQIFKELWDKNIDGEWSKIFNCLYKPDYNRYIIPDINRRGWQFAFMIMANRENKVLNSFNKLSEYLNENKIIIFKDFNKEVLKLFGTNWKYDVEDLAYFYESLSLILYEKFNTKKYVELNKNENGTLFSINLLNKLPSFNNFDNNILLYFNFKYDIIF